MGNTKPVRFNPPQREVISTGAKTAVFAGGRRPGKTAVFAAPLFLRSLQRMPRSSGAFAVPSCRHGLTGTLPGTPAAPESSGFKCGLHHYIGHKPSKTSGFEKPYIEPAEYGHAIPFHNGSVACIISRDRPGASNSLTPDCLIIDEAKFAGFEKPKGETFPASGGCRGHSGTRPYYRGMLIMSGMPTARKGSRFMRYERECGPELITAIHGIVYEIRRLKAGVKEFYQKGTAPQDCLRTRLKKLYRDPAQFRSTAVYCKEFSSMDNLPVPGENCIREMKRNLPPPVFQTSIPCRRVGILKDGFCNSMRESAHYCTASDNGCPDSPEYGFDKIRDESCLQDSGPDRDRPACIAPYCNSGINRTVAGRQHGNTVRALKSFYVKYECKLRECVRDFCLYCRHHRKKTAVCYYDSAVPGNSRAVNDEDFRTAVCDEFEKQGWDVIPVYTCKPVKHMEKWLPISRAFIRNRVAALTLLNWKHDDLTEKRKRP